MSSKCLKSPLKNIPSCWEDDKRMTVLYSPFRLREINPVDYDSKMKFWQNCILERCLEKNDCIFNVKKIQDEFRRKDRMPLGLNTVVENLERDGLIKLKDDFLKINPDESWKEWAMKSLVKTPVTWSFTKLKEALIEIDKTRLEYISIEFLKKKSEEVLSKIAGCKKLYNESELKCISKTDDGLELSQENLEILLRWMRINKLLQMTKVENDTYLKFCSEKENPISEIEISLHIIEKNKLTFEKAIQALEEEKNELILTAKSYLKKGMRDTAKSYLRRKKEVEKTIAKRVSALENVETLLSKIHDTSTDSKVLETYKMALNALKQSFKDNGLSEDEVTKTVTEIQEINEMHEEIQNALAEPVSDVCNTELEDELKEILQNEKRKVEVVLPDVPSGSPGNFPSDSKRILEDTI